MSMGWGAAVSSTWMVIRGNRLWGGQCKEAGGSGLGVTDWQPAPGCGPPRGKGSSGGPGAWQVLSWSSGKERRGRGRAGKRTGGNGARGPPGTSQPTCSPPAMGEGVVTLPTTALE